MSTLRSEVRAKPAAAPPASTASALPLQARRLAQRGGAAAAAPGKKQEASPPPDDHALPETAIYLTSLRGDEGEVPNWEPPPAPWGASALVGLPVWDDDV